MGYVQGLCSFPREYVCDVCVCFFQGKGRVLGGRDSAVWHKSVVILGSISNLRFLHRDHVSDRLLAWQLAMWPKVKINHDETHSETWLPQITIRSTGPQGVVKKEVKKQAGIQHHVNAVPRSCQLPTISYDYWGVTHTVGTTFPPSVLVTCLAEVLMPAIWTQQGNSEWGSTDIS